MDALAARLTELTNQRELKLAAVGGLSGVMLLPIVQYELTGRQFLRIAPF